MDYILHHQDFISFLQFISENFEFIIALLFALVVTTLTLMITLQLSDQEFRQRLPEYLQNALIVIIICGQAFILFSGGYILWDKAKNPKGAMNYPEDIRPNTAWLKSDQKIYFIQGNEFHSILITGKENIILYKAKESLREFHFSPDGKYAALNSFDDLILLNLLSGEATILDSVGVNNPRSQDKGSIGSIRFSPQSDKLVYEKSTWSSFTSRQKIYIYALNTKTVYELNTIPKRIFSLFWDNKGEALYFLDVKAKDLSIYSYPFEMKVFRIPLNSMELEFVGDIVIEENAVPLESLAVREVYLFMGSDKLSFLRDESKIELVSEKKGTLFIDKNDFLNFKEGSLKFKRLFKIPREADPTHPEKYQYQGGAFTLESIRWINGSEHVMLIDKHEGVLILEPVTATCGRLLKGNLQVIGWGP